ncbi:MAG: type I restriction enzyme HsdR N-terminal domain-containing protein [Mangrovibacterium sp.]
MQTLNLPKFDFRTKIENGKTLLFDEIRRKFIVLTPEEWVRQNFIKYLVNHLNYPAGLMNIEGGLQLNGHTYRADLLVCDKKGNPLLLVEFKAPQVKITQDTFDQIARYNIIYRVPYLVVSNGMQHYCCHVNFEENNYAFLKEVPSFSELKPRH